MENKLPEIEPVLHYLEHAKDDLRQRIKLKQHVIITYMLSVAAIFGFVIQQYPNKPSSQLVLFVLPLLSFLATAIYCDHMFVTTAIVRYERDNIYPLLASRTGQIRPFDISKAVKEVKANFWILQISDYTIFALQPLVSILMLTMWLIRNGAALSAVFALSSITGLAVGLLCVWLSLLVTHRMHKATEIFGQMSDD